MTITTEQSSSNNEQPQEETNHQTKQEALTNDDHNDSDSSNSTTSNNNDQKEESIPSRDDNNTNNNTNNNNTSSSKISFSQRLFNLQLRVNQAKQENIEQVKEEQEQLHYEKKAFFKHKNIIEKEMLNLNVTLEESSEFEKKRKRSQKEHAQGWESLNSDALYKSHKKRIKQTITDRSIEQYTTNNSNNNNTSNGMDVLSYGSLIGSSISEENKQAMANELTQKKKNKKKNHNGDDDDDDDSTPGLYVNRTNKHFTKSLSKAYDKYTQDIRSNLERGTAL